MQAVRKDSRPLSDQAQAAEQELCHAIEAFLSLEATSNISVKERAFYNALSMGVQASLMQPTGRERSTRMLGTHQWYRNNM